MDYKDKIRKLLALAKSPEPEEAYNTGYSEAEAQRASNPAPGKTLPQLLEQLDAGECKGIKSATAYKIAEFAREQSYLE